MNKLEIKDMEITLLLNGTITSIIGPSNSGKTVLAKRLCNKIDNSSVFIDNKCISEYVITFLRQNIAVVLDDDSYNCEFVIDELTYYLDYLSIPYREINERINTIAKYFKIKNILEKELHFLRLEDKILIKILSILIINPKVFVIDNLVSYLNTEARDLLFKYIREKHISFINLTSNSEELLLSDNVVVLNNFKCVLQDDYKNILEGNSILPYMGLNLPFIVDLSHNLILYNLVNKIYFDNRKLVDKLWK